MSRSRYPKRTINWRALGVLVVGSAVLAGILYGVNFVQVKRNMKGLLAQADQAEREGEVGVAADYVWQYLGFDPKDNDVLGRYALLAQKQARIPRQKMRVLALFEQVLRRDSGQIEIRREAAKLAVELGLAKDARTHLEELRKTDPKNEPHLLWARCEARSGEFDTAAVSYARVVAETPGDIAVWREYLATVSEGIKDPATAEGVVSRMLTANPRSAEARQLAVAYHLRAGSADKAEEHLRVAFDQLKGDFEELFLLAAEVARARGQKEQVGRYLRAGVEKHPKSVPLRLELARFEGSAGRSKAIALLQPLRNPLPTRIEQRWELGSLLADLGDTAGAEEVLAQFSGRASDWARSLLTAQLWLRKQEFGKARLLLEKLRTAQMPYPGLARFVDVMLADCYLALQSPEQAATAARRAVTADPGDLQARTRLAEALAASGKGEEATKEIAHVVAQEPSLRLQQARLLLAAQLRKPRLERDWKEVETALAQLPEPDQKQSAVLLLRAEIHAARGEWDVARKMAETAREQDPKQVEPWLFLAELARRNNLQAALDVLKEAERQVGRKVEWALARIRYLSLVGEDDARKQLRGLIAELPRWSGDDHDRLLDALGGALWQIGDAAEAEKLWRKVASHQKGNLQVRLLLLEMAAQANQPDRVKALVGEVELAEGPGGPMGCYARALAAWLAARSGDQLAVAEARQYLDRAGTLRPSWDRVAALEGDLCLLEGKKQAASQLYKQAIERGETRVAVWRRAAHVLFDLRKYGEAEALLRQLPEQVRLTGDLGRLSTALALVDVADEAADVQARRKRSLAMARKVVQAGAGGHHDQLWLAQVAWMAGRPDEAEKAVREACRLAPQEPSTWVALVSLLARIDIERARLELAAAERTLTKRLDALGLMACHEAAGQPKEAEAYARKALTEQPPSPQTLAEVAAFHARHGRGEEAEPLWRRLLAQGKSVGEELTHAARRGVGLLLAYRGKYPEFQEALKLVEANTKSRNKTAEDELAHGLVLAAHPGHRAEAMRILEPLARAHTPVSALSLLLLARLQLAERNWPQARVCLQRLVEEHPNNSDYLGRLIDGLIEKGEFEEARGVLPRLVKVAPRSPRTVALEARLLMGEGRLAEAGRHVRSLVGKEGVSLEEVAALFEQLDLPAEAERLYRQNVAKSKEPAAPLALAMHLARYRGVGEALDQCEKAWATRPDMAAQYSVAVLRRGKPAPKDHARVQRWLEQAAQKARAEALFPILLAEVCELRGDSAGAISCLRQALERDRRSVAALNNLAYFLAFGQDTRAEARRLIDEAIHLAGPLAPLLDTRAVILLLDGQPEEALTDLRRAVPQEHSALTYFHLAWGHWKANNGRAATAMFRRAVKEGLSAETVPALELSVFKELCAEGFE